MTSFATGTIMTNGTSFSLTPDSGAKPPSSPKGLIATHAAETKAGWLGQVFVDKTIVWESEPYEDSEAAIEAANARVVAAVSRLFTASTG